MATRALKSRPVFLWLAVAHLMLLLPLQEQSLSMMFAVSAFCLLARWGMLWRGWGVPGRRLVALLAISGAVFLAVYGIRLGLLNVMINLLLLAYALKFIEMHSDRDLNVLLLVGYFLIGLSFIYRQTLPWAIYLLVITLVNTAAVVSSQSHRSPVQSLRLGGKMLMYALPAALVLFLVMPRLPPLWRMPSAQSAQTGLSERVSPGDIAELSRSSRLAFRAAFERGQVPPPSQRYWRAIVHEDFDGRSWKLSPSFEQWQYARNKPEVTPIPTAQISHQYNLIVEPTYRNWLYGLGWSRSHEPDVKVTPFETLYRTKPIASRAQFSVFSAVSERLPISLSAPQRAANLALPDDANSRSRDWGMELSLRYREPLAISQAILQKFSREKYYYTLKPPLLGRANIDQFLFESKRGFCVHYASAYTYVMRAAGVPARLVSGYLGGEFNPAGNYLEVRQFDAHAWSEIWIDGEGWIRVDPTAAVAPDRVLDGLEASLDAPEEFIEQDPFALVRYRDMPVLNFIRHSLANVDYQWTVWVLNYNQQRQSELASKLAAAFSGWLRWVAMGVVALVAVGLLLLLSKIRPQQRTPEQRLLRSLERKLGRRGFRRQPGQSVADFLQQVADKRPAVAALLQAFTDGYYALRYARTVDARRSQLVLLRQTVRRVKIRH